MTTKTSSQPIAWALSPRGDLVHIQDANRGQADLVCPSCRHSLVVKKGAIQAWHFAHRALETPRPCSRESVLHYTAKRLLVEAAREGRSLLDAEVLEIAERPDIAGQWVSVGRGRGAEWIVLTGGVNECALGDGILVADALVDLADGEKLAVEICVTHAKSTEDTERFAELKQPALEIDLSLYHNRWNLDPDALRQLVLETAPRRWVWSPERDEARNSAQTALEKRLHVRNEALLQEAESHRPSDQALLQLPPQAFSCTAVSPCGRFTSTVHNERSLAQFTGPWQRLENGWSRPAKADDGTPVECRFGYRGIEALPSEQGPVFAILLGRSGIACEGWYHTEAAWPLKAQAQNELAEKAERHALESHLADDAPNNTQELFSYLCRALTLDPPPALSNSKVSGWKIPRNLWRTAAWTYLIIHRNSTFAVHGLWGWLDRLFPTRPTPREAEHQATEVARWLEEMASAGWICFSSSEHYRITLPKHFRTARPWLDQAGLEPLKTLPESLVRTSSS